MMPIPTVAQSAARPLILSPVDESQVVQLRGTVNPLAQARYDQGRVSDSFSADRMVLILNRPPEREAALQQFLSDVHQHGSATYHKWVTPEQFAELFGPADSDVQAVVGWLGSEGFRVDKISKSQQFIEFSGTAGQFRKAFRSEVHRYNVAGETHYSNAGEISIPAALAPVVRGVSPTNNFWAKPYIQVSGEAYYSRTTGRALPDWTIPNPFGTSNPNAFLVSPEDFATQYDLSPLYQAGVNGAGQTIGIINESNIDVGLVNDYRQLFNLSSNPTQIVIDGDDPGDIPGVDTEAYLDVEVSGAVAPMATVNLYISNGSDLQDPIALAAIRAVEDNQASVLSVSFGNCEEILQVAGNQFWNSLWEQAAAQGQSVFVAAGDSGPVCNQLIGLSVSGLASTPWNVAVGGTDFYYSDYATGGASALNLWSQTNDSSLGSLKAPLPEQAWDDPFGLDIISDGLARNEIFSGGGGPSSCVTLATNGLCAAGYPKPSWQTGPGVPADGVRDLPDVSLFASNGANLSAYAICAAEGECLAQAGENPLVYIVGGTSASSPAMAAIMALVDQKYGRQGQADYVLYPLAQQKPSAFHDVTLGGNYSPCFQGSAECVLNSSGDDETTVYAAGPNYDLASGLGSVDANILINNWNSITFLPTSTTLSLSATKITHGTPVTVTTTVSGSSGSATPTGGVAILTNSPEPSNQSQAVIPLSDGSGTSSINYFPGGYYNVIAGYQGDGIYGASASVPVPLSVTSEDSNINLTITSGQNIIGPGGSIQYDSLLALNVQPIGVTAAAGKTDGNATGNATFTLDSSTSVEPMNSVGIASWSPPALSVGTHTASATYSGDASFNSSSAAPVTFNVTKGTANINDSINGYFSSTSPAINVNTGGSLTINVVVKPFNNTPGVAAPTGTVTFCLGFQEVCLNPSYSMTATLSSPAGALAQESSATVTFTNLAAGDYFPTYSYSGDSNWLSGGLLDVVSIIVGPPSGHAASTTTLTVSPSSISGTQFTTLTTTVQGTGSSGIAPTGLVDYYNNGVFLTYVVLTPAKTGATTSISFVLNSSAFWNNGPNQITAIYQGDNNYQPSTSNAVSVTVSQTVGDFTLSPQSPQIVLQPGDSGTVELNLTSLKNFNGSVNLVCSTSSPSVTCGVNPPSISLNGANTASLMITAPAQAASVPPRSTPFNKDAASAGTFGLMAVALILLPVRKRRLAALASLALAAILIAMPGCGGGQSGHISPPPPPTYSSFNVVVTGTANGITHNAKITVLVP
jgi:hypothetical protein